MSLIVQVEPFTLPYNYSEQSARCLLPYMGDKQRNEYKCYFRNCFCIFCSRFPQVQNCPNVEIGLLARSGFDAFPVRFITSGRWMSKSVVCLLTTENLQQRKLLPIYTAFPFSFRFMPI